MGLDMYLYARKSSFKTRIKEDKDKLFIEYPEELKEFADDMYDRFFQECIVEYAIGYWRKFNALHCYIVENFAENGVDDCKPIYLDGYDIEQIVDTIKSILVDKDKAKELMPPADGFFFGSTEISDWYFEDLEYSLWVFEKTLDAIRHGYSIYYQASW